MSERYFITGATGLVGAALTERLAHEGHEVVVWVRNPEKAQKIFADLGSVSIMAGLLEEPIHFDGDVDYVIHAAAPTNSSFFVEHPVETIDSIVMGTRSVLNFAREKSVKSVVNLSSMEVYGTPTNGEDLTEDKQFYLDPLNVRSNYPIAKRLAENMSVAYSLEYDVPVKIARLAQVLGTKLLPDDNRVIAQFIRSAKNGTDIEIATDGETKQTYVGIEDALDAILMILKKGKNGEAYNIANDDTYCSIREVAELVASNVVDKTINVRINTAERNGKYPPNRTLRINSSKLRSLGWVPTTTLEQSLNILAE